MDNSDGSGFEISPRLSRSSRHVGGSYSSSTSANSRGKSRTTIRKTSSSNNGNNNHSDGLLHHGGKGNSFFGLTGFQSPRRFFDHFFILFYLALHNFSFFKWPLSAVVSHASSCSSVPASIFFVRRCFVVQFFFRRFLKFVTACVVLALRQWSECAR